MGAAVPKLSSASTTFPCLKILDTVRQGGTKLGTGTGCRAQADLGLHHISLSEGSDFSIHHTRKPGTSQENDHDYATCHRYEDVQADTSSPTEALASRVEHNPREREHVGTIPDVVEELRFQLLSHDVSLLHGVMFYPNSYSINIQQLLYRRASGLAMQQLAAPVLVYFLYP